MLDLQLKGTTVSLQSPNAWSSGKELTDNGSIEADLETAGTQCATKTPVTADKTKLEDDENEVKRRTGDTAVWSYYAKSIGPLHSVLLITFTLVSVLATNSPRESLRSDSINLIAADYDRPLAQG